jgi:cytochrome c oxidase cbb3-type subunit III
MNRINRRILFALSLFAALSAARGAALADAAETFKFYCAQCHGVSGKGDGPNVTKNFPVSPRDFTNAKEMNKLSNADLKNVIMDGGPSASKSPMMPPWGKTLKESDVDALVKHLRVLCKCKGKPG